MYYGGICIEYPYGLPKNVLERVSYEVYSVLPLTPGNGL